MPLRKESARTGPLRLIDVQDYDLSACGGTHVERTGAIGMIAIGGWEKFKGGSRVEFLCGGRALQRFRVWRGALSAMQKHLSVPPIEMAASIERMQEDAKAVQRTVRGFQEKLAAHEGAGPGRTRATHRRHAVDRGSARGLGSAGTEGDRRRRDRRAAGSGRRALHIINSRAGRHCARPAVERRCGRAAQTAGCEIWREGRRQAGPRAGRRTGRASRELVAYVKGLCSTPEQGSRTSRVPKVPEVSFCWGFMVRGAPHPEPQKNEPVLFRRHP